MALEKFGKVSWSRVETEKVLHRVQEEIKILSKLKRAKVTSGVETASTTRF
jgi:hypothetical protein